MFIIGNFLAGVVKIADILLNLYMWMIIVRAILSWVSVNPYNPLVRFLHQATDPVFYEIRRRLPIGGFGIDVSPVIVILVIVFLRSAILPSLFRIAYSLQ